MCPWKKLVLAHKYCPITDNNTDQVSLKSSCFVYSYNQFIHIKTKEPQNIHIQETNSIKMDISYFNLMSYLLDKLNVMGYP